MAVPLSMLRFQAPVLRALAGTALRSRLRPRWTSAALGSLAPGAPLERELPPRPPALVERYLRALAIDPARYAGYLPPHLFPQWGLPLLAATMAPIPLDLTRVLNGGCRLEQRQALPAGAPLRCRAQLLAIDHGPERCVLEQELLVGTAQAPEALRVVVTAFLPGPRRAGPGKPKPDVPVGARLLGRWQADRRAGRDFALLTGDVNPIHWLGPAARLAGFQAVILHGFSILARTWEVLVAARAAGDPRGLARIGVRFVRPCVLPADVGVWEAQDGALAVGPAAGGPALMIGEYGLRADERPAERPA